MPTSELTEVASRLCLACGMCCNGVLFHIVRLQPTDSIRDLDALGMQINRKKHEPYFRQPCTFLSARTCTIYDARPTRCRLFECQQIKDLRAGEIDEAQALNMIEGAKRLVEEIEAMLAAMGDTAKHLPLLERCESVREALSHEPPPQLPEFDCKVSALTSLLNRQFRMQSSAGSRSVASSPKVEFQARPLK